VPEIKRERWSVREEERRLIGRVKEGKNPSRGLAFQVCNRKGPHRLVGGKSRVPQLENSKYAPIYSYRTYNTSQLEIKL
jgi:hypothetical protein